MRTLVITGSDPIVPGYDVSGLGQRFSMFMRVLAGVSERIDLLHMVPPHLFDRFRDPEALARGQSEQWGVPVTIELVPVRQPPKTFWSHYGAGILSIHGHPFFHGPTEPLPVAAVARHIAHDPDLVFAHRLGPMCSLLRTGLSHRNIVFDLDDIEHRVQARHALAPPWRPGSVLYLSQVPAIRHAERRAIRASRAVFVCSELDRAHLWRLGWGRNVTVIPNAVRLPRDEGVLVASPTVLFLGNLGYPPNAAAAERLATRIWPLVHKARPDATLLIAGKWHESIPSSRHPPAGVQYLGFVPDLDRLYAGARVVCCPIDVGGGTRIKLIEAAAYGKPIVSTAVGAEGLGLQDGVHALIRDSDQAFAEACLQLLEKDELCRRLRDAARAKAEADYGADEIEGSIRKLMLTPA